MNVKVPSSELGRIMRIMSGCIDTKDQKNSNVEISHADNMFSVRAVSNGQFVKMSTPLLGGDGETFCVDGKMFANIIGRSSGDVEIKTDEQNCFVKSNGRTRIPLLKAKLANPSEVDGNAVKIGAAEFISVADRVRYAASQEETRPILTGILMNASDGCLTMAAVDGFQMSACSAKCEGADMKVVVPNILVKRMCDCASAGETITVSSDRTHVSMTTDTVQIVGNLLQGDFIDYQRIVPNAFSTGIMVNVKALKDALNGSGVVCNAKNLVKFIIEDGRMTITSNSEKAEFECEVECERIGNDLTIAFNDKYVLNALSAINGNDVSIHMNSPVSPAIFTETGKDDSDIHLVLPVRVQ